MQAELKNRSRPVIRKTESHLACRRSKHTLPHRLRFEALENRRLLSVGSNLQWVEEGPFRIQVNSGLGPGGAVEAVAVHPTNPDVLYLAAVNGGVWLTKNATSQPPTWKPLTDQQDSLSMGAIAFDLSDTTHNTLYAGNGNFSNFRVNGPQLGLLKTTDGGDNWSEIARTVFAGQHVETILPTRLAGQGCSTLTVQNCHVNLVATNNGNGGIFRSEDSDEIWSRVSGSQGLPNAGATDVIGDTSHPNRFYAGIPGHGVFVTEDGGQRWQAFSDGMPTAITTGSVRILLDASRDTVAGIDALYSAVVGSDGNLAGVFRRTSLESAWTQLTNVPQIHFNSQGFHNTTLAAVPDDIDVFFIGGDQGPAVYRGEVTTTSPFTIDWQRVTFGDANNSAPHADTRDLVFDLNGNLLQTDDGGIYRLINPHDASRHWESLNNNLRATEVVGAAYDSLNDVVLAGFWDNGIAEQSAPSSGLWRSVSGGDGSAVQVEVDGNDSYRYMYQNNLGCLLRRRFDQDNNLVSETTVTLGAPGSDVHLSGLSEDERTSLLADNCGTPSSSSVVPNAVTAGRLVIGTGRLYESKNRGDTIEDITPEGMSTIREARAIASGARSGETALPEVLYVTTGLVRGEMIGIESQLWLRRPEGGPLSQLTYPAEAVVAKDVALDPQDWRNIYFVDANGRVWHTSDATATPLVWNELTADRDGTRGLPTNLRTIEVVRFGKGPPVPLVGGEGGVYRRSRSATDPNSTSWTEFGRGLPNAITMSLDYDKTHDVLVAGMAGRGVWIVPNASRLAGSVVIGGDEHHFTDIFAFDETIWKGDKVEPTFHFPSEFTAGDRLAVGDFEGDGVNQIVIAGDDTGTIDIFNLDNRSNLRNSDTASPDTKFLSGVKQTPPFFVEFHMATGDVDGDGRDEIIIVGGQGHLVHIFTYENWKNVKHGDLAVPKWRFDANFNADDGLAVGDVDGDGRDEILIGGDATEVIDIFAYDPEVWEKWIISDPPIRPDLASFKGQFTEGDALAAGDINGDGRDEIVIGGDDEHFVDVFLYEDWVGATNGENKEPTYHFNGNFTDGDGLAVGDLNADGLDEIVIAGDDRHFVDVFLFDDREWKSGRQVTPTYHVDANFTENDALAIIPPPDTDRDGLNDAWETNGIDVDGDNIIDLDLVARRCGSAPQRCVRGSRCDGRVQSANAVNYRRYEYQSDCCNGERTRFDNRKDGHDREREG